MTPSEKLARRLLTAKGWRVLRNGWPDFLCSRDGLVRAVEVKGQGDRVCATQASIHRALYDAGIVTFTLRFRKGNEVFTESLEGLDPHRMASAGSHSLMLDDWRRVRLTETDGQRRARERFAERRNVELYGTELEQERLVELAEL